MNLLRGVCQMPAYVARDEGFFRDLGLEVEIDIVPTAWQIPGMLARRDCDFSILPWTRSALDALAGGDLVVVCGSGEEEAAIVVRTGCDISDVRSVALPKRGGLKDLTAQALLDSLGWTGIEEVRQPLGDGAILALVGGGADAASMIEPYATVMEERGIGRIVRRTGDVWPGAPGCSLTTTRLAIEQEPEMVSKVVEGFVRGAGFIESDTGRAAEIGARYVGVSAENMVKALAHNRPNVHAIANHEAIEGMLSVMLELGYIDRLPEDYIDLGFLEKVGTPKRAD